MFVTTILAKVREFLRYRETVRELSQLSDRELDDLGITRFRDPLDRPRARGRVISAALQQPPRPPFGGRLRRWLAAGGRGLAIRLIRPAGAPNPGRMSLPSPIHVVGGGLAGSEAAWQIAEAGVPAILHEMRPGARHRRPQDRRPGRARLLQLLPLRRCRDQCGRPAAPGDAPPRLAHHARTATPTRCRPAARLPSTATASPTR